MKKKREVFGHFGVSLLAWGETPCPYQSAERRASKRKEIPGQLRPVSQWVSEWERVVRPGTILQVVLENVKTRVRNETGEHGMKNNGIGGGVERG